MAKVRVIEVHENVFNTNNQEADALRKRLKDKKVTMINVMSSPGSGKTTLLSHAINEIKDDYKVGVMDVDIETSLDAQKVADFTGVPSIQIHNGGLCHIDAEMTTRAVDEFGVDDFDFLFLENIGNLVEFFRGVAALVDNQAVVAVPLQTVQGVVTLIEALKHMGRVDDRIQIREGIQAGQVNLGSERDGLFCFFFLAGSGRVLEFLFNKLLEHIQDIVGAFRKDTAQIVRVFGHGAVAAWCEFGEAGVQLFRILDLGDNQDDAFVGHGNRFDHQRNIVSLKTKFDGCLLHHFPEQLLGLFCTVGQFTEL